MIILDKDVTFTYTRNISDTRQHSSKIGIVNHHCWKFISIDSINFEGLVRKPAAIYETEIHDEFLFGLHFLHSGNKVTNE